MTDHFVNVLKDTLAIHIIADVRLTLIQAVMETMLNVHEDSYAGITNVLTHAMVIIAELMHNAKYQQTAQLNVHAQQILFQ